MYRQHNAASIEHGFTRFLTKSQQFQRTGWKRGARSQFTQNFKISGCGIFHQKPGSSLLPLQPMEGVPGAERSWERTEASHGPSLCHRPGARSQSPAQRPPAPASSLPHIPGAPQQLSITALLTVRQHGDCCGLYAAPDFAGPWSGVVHRGFLSVSQCSSSTNNVSNQRGCN